MKTQFDITEISNLIIKCMIRDFLKEVPSERINDAEYRAWLKKQYVKAYKSMPQHIKCMCGLTDEMIYRGISKNMTRFEIDVDDYI